MLTYVPKMSQEEIDEKVLELESMSKVEFNFGGQELGEDEN